MEATWDDISFKSFPQICGTFLGVPFEGFEGIQ